ncbi:glycosyltransferase [Crassaminicella indica]|uniref:Glycosyltransferase n=1 Tax=Crassaminicella indica TaxID=2855394 RepID=A0ABX8RCB0_9CLOT|nr:glycosyltransferase [Crassaminicella indica]QXM06679.1 glycosyltransferase [Crassaminicella indica]
MKIMVLVPSLQEKGPIIVAENIAKYSNDPNFEYIFVSLRNNSQQDIQRFKNNHIKTYDIGMGKIPFKRDILKIKNIIEQEKPDIIHVHSFWPTIIISKNFSSYRSITTLHNNPMEDFTYQYGEIIGRLMTYFMNKALMKIDKKIAISEYIKNVYCKTGFENIDVIYNGIEDNLKNAEQNIDTEINIVSISVLNKCKNIFKALDIIKLLKDKKIKVKYRIIGDGILKNKIEKYIVNNDIQDIVQLVGKVEREKVFEYIQKSDVLLFTSLSEGFGLVVVESMMMKKPAIVSDIPVMHEIVDNYENGIIAKSDNDYVKAIQFLYKHNNYEIMSNNARKKYESKFRVEKMSIEYEEKYHEMIGR